MNAAHEIQLGCPECDLLLALPEVRPGQRARCSRCGFLLTRNSRDPFGRSFAFASAGLVMLGIALSFSFLSINTSGIENAMTLAQTVSLLSRYGANGIALLVLVFVIGVPLVMMLWMMILSLSLRFERFGDWQIAPTRWLFHLNAWAMVEVFAIGVIVSLVKLSSMAKVELGISFFAYLAFTVLFIAAFTALDRMTVWTQIQALRDAR